MSIAVEFAEVSKLYRDNLIVDNVSFSLKTNTITTLIGPNGAGKTTIAKLLLRVEKPTTGQIIYHDKVTLSYVPQRIYLNHSLPISVSDFLHCTALHNEGNTELIMDFVKINDIKDKQLFTLSGGQMQKVIIAASLLQKANLIVFDEPTQGLDVSSQQQFYELIKIVKQQRKVTIFIISHDLHTIIPTADQVLCLNRHICCSDGNVKQLSTSSKFTASNSQLGIYTHNHDHTHN